jgi:type IV secretory pathway VirB10-like protein
MMRFCPKCRTFYDDADLKFCLNDGVPLIKIGENSDLQREGTEAIRQTKHQIRRETFKKQIKKIVSIMITTILMVMIISVITINSWIYFDPQEEEIVQNEEPIPTPEPTIEVLPKPSPSVQKTVSPTPTPKKTPTPTPTPKEEIKVDVKPVCLPNERAVLQNQILTTFGKSWGEKFLADRESVKQTRINELARECEKMKMPTECKNFIKNTEAELGERKGQSIIASTDCQTVTATVTFEWKTFTPQFPPKTIPKINRFLYQKQGNGWQLIKVF